MRIMALVQGQYGNRIVEHLRRFSPQGWSIEVVRVLDSLPPVVDDPEEFLPTVVSKADLLLALTESSSAAQLITYLAKLAGTKAVIVPVDNPAWMPAGLENQLKRELAGIGATCVFPKTFCTLTETSAGFHRKAKSYENEYISSFARYFGQPRIKIEVDSESMTITEVIVERGAPCGSTHFTAQRLIGMNIDEVVPQAGLIAHIYPCLASMQIEEIDDGLFETIMHISGYVVNDNLDGEIEVFRRARDNL